MIRPDVIYLCAYRFYNRCCINTPTTHQHDQDSLVLNRFFGVDMKAGMDLKCITGKGKFFGYEIKATATMVNYEAGPIVVHLAAGISSGTKIEGGTIESRFLGCGTKIGKRIGLSIFDSELSIETLALFGKSWHWGTRK